MSTAARRNVIPAALVLILAGIAAFALALRGGRAVFAWEAFLVNLLFWLGAAQGGIIVSASLYLTQARWGGAASYRLAEAASGFVPLGFLLFWCLFPARGLLFPWIRHPIAAKAAWLNVPFLFARDGGGLCVLALLNSWFVHCSRRPDAVAWAEASDSIELPPAAIRRLAPSLIVTYVVVYSLIGFDLVMSLSPVWYSTLFGAYFFAGAYWCALALMGLAAASGWCPTPRAAQPGHATALHDIAKLVFAFSIFWAYLLWSQYLPIWYAGLPEETFFIVVRIHRWPWNAWAWTVLVLVWVVPFVALLGKYPKRSPAIVGSVCASGLIGMWMERYLLVAPSLSPTHVPFGWLQLLMTAGFLGAFVLCAIPGLRHVSPAIAVAGSCASDAAMAHERAANPPASIGEVARRWSEFSAPAHDQRVQQ